MTSILLASIAVNRRYFHRRIGVDNDISSSSFDCNDTRIIFINRYVRSIEISSSNFDCNETRVSFIEYYVWKNKRSSSSFDCGETPVIFFEEYVSTLKSVHPASIAVKHALV